MMGKGKKPEVSSVNRGKEKDQPKVGKGKKQELSDHILTLRRRLDEALSLGFRLLDNKEKRWQCIDAEIQLHALRAMSAFINSMPSASLTHSLIKESASDMLLALEVMLQSEHKRVIWQALDLTRKLVSILGKSVGQFPVQEIIISLQDLLPAEQVSITCAVALNLILLNLGTKSYQKNSEVWKVMEEKNTVSSVISAVQGYVDGIQPTEYFIEMSSLLITMIWKWSPFRYHVWSNPKLMDSLQNYCGCSDTSITLKVLKLCSALALCGNGAMKIIERKELICKIMESIGNTQPNHVRIEALRLCQHLMRSAEGCSLLISSYCQQIVQGVVSAMGEWRSSHAKRIPLDQMPLVMQACRTASMTRWAGKHHACFWNLDIDTVLLDNLIGNCSANYQTQAMLFSDELISKVCDNITDTASYIWDILGWLASYCNKDFLPKTKGQLCALDVLISCACAVATYLILRGQSSISCDVSSISSDVPNSEPVLRAVLLMVLSPSNYMASKARSCLSEMAKPHTDILVEKLLVNLRSSGDVFLYSNSHQVAVNLIGLASYSIIPRFHNLIVKKKGLRTISTIVERCLNSDIKVSRSSIASHLQYSSERKTCCWEYADDWEGTDILLFYALQAFAQLIPYSNFGDHYKIASRDIVACLDCKDSEAHDLIKTLHSVMSNNLSPGPRWYAAYILSFFGFYGITSEIGKRMERALNENELADLQFMLSNGQSLRAHRAILLARCPYLLPSVEVFLKDKLQHGGSMEEHMTEWDLRRHEVRMSDRVDYCALVKILEYSYTGFSLIEDSLLKPLQILAKCCGLKPLLHVLHRKLPLWGSPSPNYFTGALDPTPSSIFDVILEANASEVDWKCSLCQSSMPHMHAHKIILWASCGYLRALFQSGMQDSYSQIIKVPIGWDALSKLVTYFYSGNLPKIKTDCTWNNMDANKQLREVLVYVELSSLSEFWLLDEIAVECLDIVASCLNFDPKMIAEFIHRTVELSQWKMVEIAVRSIAHLYPKMRNAGDLANFNGEVAEMLRREYVWHSQNSL